MDTVFFVGILALALVKATPIAFGAMSGLMCERSGVINIAIEGMMLMGAMFAFLGSVFFNDLTGGELPKAASLIAGAIAAMLAAGLIAFLHAYLSIHYKVDQIISGTVINLLAIGITNFTANAFIDPNGIAGVGVFSVISISLRRNSSFHSISLRRRSSSLARICSLNWRSSCNTLSRCSRSRCLASSSRRRCSSLNFSSRSLDTIRAFSSFS